MLKNRLNEILHIAESLEGNCTAENLAALKKKIKQTQDEIEPDNTRLIVKHYVSDEYPTIKGLGTEIHVVGDREDAEEFASIVNTAIHALGK